MMAVVGHVLTLAAQAKPVGGPDVFPELATLLVSSGVLWVLVWGLATALLIGLPALMARSDQPDPQEPAPMQTPERIVLQGTSLAHAPLYRAEAPPRAREPSDESLKLVPAMSWGEALAKRIEEYRHVYSSNHAYLKRLRRRRRHSQAKLVEVGFLVKRNQEQLKEAKDWQKRLVSDGPFGAIRAHAVRPTRSQALALAEAKKRFNGALPEEVFFVEPNSVFGDMVGLSGLFGMLWVSGLMHIVRDADGSERRLLALNTNFKAATNTFSATIHETLHYFFMPPWGFLNPFELQLHEGITEYLAMRSVSHFLRYGRSAFAGRLRRAAKRTLRRQGLPDAAFVRSSWKSLYPDLVKESSGYGSAVSAVERLIEVLGESSVMGMYAQGRFNTLYERLPALLKVREDSRLNWQIPKDERTRFWHEAMTEMGSPEKPPAAEKTGGASAQKPSADDEPSPTRGGRWPWREATYQARGARAAAWLKARGVAAGWAGLVGRLLAKVGLPTWEESVLFLFGLTVAGAGILSLASGLPLALSPPLVTLISGLLAAWLLLHVPGAPGKTLRAKLAFALSPEKLLIAALSLLALIGGDAGFAHPEGLAFTALLLGSLMVPHLAVNGLVVFWELWGEAVPGTGQAGSAQRGLAATPAWLPAPRAVAAGLLGDALRADALFHRFPWLAKGGLRRMGQVIAVVGWLTLIMLVGAAAVLAILSLLGVGAALLPAAQEDMPGTISALTDALCGVFRAIPAIVWMLVGLIGSMGVALGLAGPQASGPMRLPGTGRGGPGGQEPTRPGGRRTNKPGAGGEGGGRGTGGSGAAGSAGGPLGWVPGRSGRMIRGSEVSPVITKARSVDGRVLENFWSRIEEAVERLRSPPGRGR